MNITEALKASRKPGIFAQFGTSHILYKDECREDKHGNPVVTMAFLIAIANNKILGEHRDIVKNIPIHLILSDNWSAGTIEKLF